MNSTREVFGRIARNRTLRRVLVAYALYIVCEYGLWIAMLVFAYEQGGATMAGLVGVAQLLPSVFVAPLVASIADRRSPVTVLRSSYEVQAVGSAATAAALFAGLAPVVAYGGAVIVSTAIATTRPAQSALLPALTTHVQELTAANVLIGWAESIGILIAGTCTGLVLTFGNVGDAFAIAALLLGTAVMLLAPLRSLSLDRGAANMEAETAATAGSLGHLLRDRPARLLVGLLGAEYVVIGALDVLFVVMAIDLLHAGQPWAGYLNTAYGAGALLLGTAAAFLVGRRLGPIVVAMALILGIALASASVAKLLGVVILLAVVGGSRALFDVAVRVLLQRTVAPGLLGRIFGLAEGLSMAGLAIGCVLAPLLVSLGGAQFALLSTAVVLPGVVLTRVEPLYRLDLHARVPVVEISLLRQLTIFRALPGAAIEGLAHALDKTSFEPGAVLVKEGDEGNCYYAIVEGTVEIRRRGQPIALLHRGQGLGEIALLRAVPRTATAVALTPVDAYCLGRDAFLTTVNGHVPTLKSTDQLVSDIQARDASRDAASPLSQPPNNSGSDSVPGEE